MGDAELEEYEEIENLDELDAEEEAKANDLAALKQQQEEGAPAGADAGADQPSADGFDKDMQQQVDSRSIYVGNVDYSIDSKAIAEFFSSCGTVNRVTIPGNKDKHPKGYAYVEFLEPEAVDNALKLENSEVGGRNIKVARKRTNEMGFSRGRGGRGRVPRGRGRGRNPWGGMMPVMPMPFGFDPYMSGGYVPYGRGFSRGGRGRGRGRGAGRGRGEQEADAAWQG
eukprot:jgi/Ulvmu1/5187/UM021_0204.1